MKGGKNMDPLEELRQEHGAVMKGFTILLGVARELEEHNPAAVDHLHRILEFMTVFIDQCHHAKEEEFLFPVMEKAHTRNSRLIAELISEHEDGRRMTAVLEAALGGLKQGSDRATAQFVGTIRDYVQVFRTHIRKENGSVFPEARELLSENDRLALARQFEKLEAERIGKGRHEAFHRMIEELLPHGRNAR
jgi:hemerythrin-like domain-containing protein